MAFILSPVSGQALLKIFSMYVALMLELVQATICDIINWT
jgi:hypothetical protein